MTITTKKNV